MSIGTDSFVKIDISSLVRKCKEWAGRCVEKGDILPPASAFDPNTTKEMFCLFDFQAEKKYGQIRHKIHKIIYEGSSFPQTLENLFTVRCMALLAAKQISLSFVQYCGIVNGSLFSSDERTALYWALTYFWQYSERAFRETVWNDEICRLNACHDITLLKNCWTRGKVGDELSLEMAEKREREAREHLDQCGKIVMALKQRMPQKSPMKKNP